MMRGLSLLQPWASLVANGSKQYETRGWPTQYRGPIAIHASRRFSAANQRLCWTDPFDALLQDEPPDALPLGCIIAVANLKTCITTDLFSVLDFASPRRRSDEHAVGDWSPGRYAFQLEDVRPVGPINCLGALGLWTVAPTIEAEIQRQLDDDPRWDIARRLMSEELHGRQR